eukprot:2376566-Pleurochrysis_carterae.AAC.1
MSSRRDCSRRSTRSVGSRTASRRASAATSAACNSRAARRARFSGASRSTRLYANSSDTRRAHACRRTSGGGGVETRRGDGPFGRACAHAHARATSVCAVCAHVRTCALPLLRPRACSKHCIHLCACARASRAPARPRCRVATPRLVCTSHRRRMR